MSEVIRSKRGQAVLISLHNDPDLVGGKTLRWSVLSGEGHCASAMARMVGMSAAVALRIARGLSSAGRASALQAEGHRFDPDRLHQEQGCANLRLARVAHLPRNVPQDRFVRRSRNGMWVGSSGG